MRSIGPWQLLDELESHEWTETWLAHGPGRGGAPEQVRLTRCDDRSSQEGWRREQAARVRGAIGLGPPWEQTIFVGAEGREVIHVQELVLGVQLSQLATLDAPLELRAWRPDLARIGQPKREKPRPPNRFFLKP